VTGGGLSSSGVGAPSINVSPFNGNVNLGGIQSVSNPLSGLGQGGGAGTAPYGSSQPSPTSLLLGAGSGASQPPMQTPFSSLLNNNSTSSNPLLTGGGSMNGFANNRPASFGALLNGGASADDIIGHDDHDDESDTFSHSSDEQNYADNLNNMSAMSMGGGAQGSRLDISAMGGDAALKGLAAQNRSHAELLGLDDDADLQSNAVVSRPAVSSGASTSLASTLAAVSSVNINKISLQEYDIDFQYNDIKQVISRSGKVFIVRENGFDVFEDEMLVKECEIAPPVAANTKGQKNQNKKSQKNQPPTPTSPPVEISKIFVDPHGIHILIACKNSQNYYFNMDWERREKSPKLLSKLASIQIESVGWNKGNPVSPYDAGLVLLGTTDGKIYEIHLLDDIEPIANSSLCFDFKERTDAIDTEPITAITIEPGPFDDLENPEDHKSIVLVCTQQKIFSFVGGPDPIDVFQVYKLEQPLVYKEFPFVSTGANDANGDGLSGGMDRHIANGTPENGTIPSQLSTFINFDAEHAESFAWLCPAGIFHGCFDYKDLDAGVNPIPEVEIIKWDQKNPAAVSIAITEFHMFVLTEDKLSVFMQPANLVNRPVDGFDAPPEVSFSSIRKVYEKVFDKKVEGLPRGLCYDASNGEVFAYTDSTVSRVIIEDEYRDVWKLFLQRATDPRTSKPELFNIAERLVKGEPRETNLVLTKRANYLFDQGQYQEAALLYHRTLNPFEEIAMKFATRNQFDALRVYLTKKLQRMKDRQRDHNDAKYMATQFTCICTWLTELYVSKLDELIAEEKKRATLAGYSSTDAMAKENHHALQHKSSKSHKDSEADSDLDETDDLSIISSEYATSTLGATESHNLSPLEAFRLEFHEFLDEHQEHVNKTTTFRIIESHGHMEEVLYYAELIYEFKRVISHHIVSQNYKKALEILEMKCRSSRFEDHFYMFAPVLMEHLPKETVNVLMKKKFLDPGKLIPSLMRYKMHQNHKDAAASKKHDNYIIEYLHWCIIVNENKDPAIHNLLLSMYAEQDEDEKLLAMLETSPHYYDSKYALRICQRHGKTQACVQLFMSMNLLEDAVKLALRANNVELARECADSVHSIPPVGGASGGAVFSGFSRNTEMDEQREKRLWLMIAKYVIESSKNDENNIQKAIAFLETTDVLQLEDILPLFPDFKQIKTYRDIIVKSLEDHKSEIETLKHQMEDANDSSSLIRGDIQNLKHRCVVVDSTGKCCSHSCNQPLIAQDFYMFPCGHKYHTKCLIYDLRKACSSIMRQRIDELVAQLKSKDTRIQAQIGLDNLISSECLLCGDYTINSIDSRFIGPGDVTEGKSWALKSKAGADDDDSDDLTSSSIASDSSDDSIYISDEDL